VHAEIDVFDHFVVRMEAAEPTPTAESPFELLFVCSSPLHEAQCEVALDERCYRKLHGPTEHRIEELWQAKLASDARVFNGTKFRLGGWECGRRPCADGSVEAQLVLRLGLTDYREYIGTNLRPEPELAELQEAGRANHGGDPTACLSNALGVETMLVTADGKMVLLRRSGAVATHTGLYNGPSGHPEPSHVPGCVDLARSLQPQGVTETLASRVLHELFDSVRQETHEETNVPLESLDDPQLIGAMAEIPTSKPDLLFVSRTTLSAAEVVACFKQGGTDAWESDRVLVVDATSHDAIRRMLESGKCSGASPITGTGGTGGGTSRAVALTSVTAACLTCYLRVQESGENDGNYA
jgi:hypothetical protein